MSLIQGRATVLAVPTTRSKDGGASFVLSSLQFLVTLNGCVFIAERA